MIEARDISKVWDDGTVALEEVSLQVGRGTIHGLIGADGAGKSTLFDILVTLVRPDEGEATVGGYDIRSEWRAVRRTVGYMPSNFSLYGDLSVRENLNFFARIYGRSAGDIESLMGDIWRQLEPFAGRPAAQLSGGMKQKLALCCAMVHDPAVLMLDEPTTGVDPVSRREFWEALRTLAEEREKTVLVSTSYMDEAARCDRITLLHEGVVIDELAPDDVAGRYRGTLYEIDGGDRALHARLLQTLRGWSLSGGCYSVGDRIHLNVPLPNLRGETVESYLRAQGIEPGRISVRVTVPTVEDLFIRLTSVSEDDEEEEPDAW